MRESHRPPKHLKPATRRWWKSVLEEYDLEAHHVRILTLAAEAWDRCQEAREIVDREGLTYKDRFGQPKERPEVAIERDSRIAFWRGMRELALDVDAPADVSRPPLVPGRANLRAVR
jgi:P27 family predicted phage terminase small subunit